MPSKIFQLESKYSQPKVHIFITISTANTTVQAVLM